MSKNQQPTESTNIPQDVFAVVYLLILLAADFTSQTTKAGLGQNISPVILAQNGPLHMIINTTDLWLFSQSF